MGRRDAGPTIIAVRVSNRLGGHCGGGLPACPSETLKLVGRIRESAGYWAMWTPGCWSGPCPQLRPSGTRDALASRRPPRGVPGKRATTGCRARYCAGSTPRKRGAPRTMALPGSPGERDPVCCSGNEGGRRRAIGVVAALPRFPRATTPMGRRWAAEGGPEGRCRGHGNGNGRGCEACLDAGRLRTHTEAVPRCTTEGKVLCWRRRILPRRAAWMRCS